MAGSDPIDRLSVEIEVTSNTAETKLGNISKLLESVKVSAARAVSPLKAIREALNSGKKQSDMQGINKAMEETRDRADILRKTISRISSGLDAVKFSKELGRIDSEINKLDQKIQSLRGTLSYLKMPVSGVSATGKLGVADEVAEAEAKLKELERVRSMLKDQRAALWSNTERQTGGAAQQVVDTLTKGLKNADLQALKTSRSLSEMQDRLAALERVKGFIKTLEYQTAAGQIRDYANAVDTATERVNALKSALDDAQVGKPGMSMEGVSRLVKDYQSAKEDVQHFGTAAGYALKDAERAAKSAGGEVNRLAKVFQQVRSSALSGLKLIGKGNCRKKKILFWRYYTMANFLRVLFGIVLVLDTIGSALMVASLVFSVKKQMKAANADKKSK